MNLIIHFVALTLAVIIAAYAIEGIKIKGIKTYLVAALIIGGVNAVLGWAIHLFTWPFEILTLHLLTLVIFLFVNLMAFIVAATALENFKVEGAKNYLYGSLVVAGAATVLDYLLPVIF